MATRKKYLVVAADGYYKVVGTKQSLDFYKHHVSCVADVIIQFLKSLMFF